MSYSGPLTAYRIYSPRYDPLSGDGAAQHPGRWNPLGRRAVYCGLTYAICLLERLVHANGPLPSGLMCVKLEIPKALDIEKVLTEDAPTWQEPGDISATIYSAQWFREVRSAALDVPSLPGQPYERNLVLNPEHPAFKRIKIVATTNVLWDERLFEG